MNQGDAIVQYLIDQGITVTTAESCTGGLLAARIVDTPGSSAILKEAFVTYSNEAKIRRLGVSEQTLDEKSEYSAACAAEMACGARLAAGADIGISTTGIAGPDGGSDDKPVGLVYIGLSRQEGTQTYQYQFSGDRRSVREQAVEAALQILKEEVQAV